MEKLEGRYIKGGNGSHWEGCEETHWDCKIAKLEEENALLRGAAWDIIEAYASGYGEKDSISKMRAILARLQK